MPTIIDISGLGDLDGYAITDDGRLRLGANLVFQRFLEDDRLKEHMPHMPACAVWFADDQIRRQATIGGNIVNASPAADGVPPLIALDAAVELTRLDDGERARRTVPLADFITGPGRTEIARGEILTAIACDSAKGYGGSFEKVGHRRSLVISVVCATCCVKVSTDGTSFEDVRLGLGGVGPVPERLIDVEEFLQGKPITADVIAEAAEMPTDRVASRTRRDYRRDVVRGFTVRAIIDALADTGVSIPEDRMLAHG